MSKTMKHNGAGSHKAGGSPTNRVADETAGVSEDCCDENGTQDQDADAPAQHEHKTEGKTGKVLLGIGAAVVAIVATEYALRKFTKTGGIIPHLLRLEKLSNAYLASIEKKS